MVSVDVLGRLSEAGVSVWLDDISRDRLRTSNLQMLIDDFHVVGVTSNPTIFAKSLSSGDAYDQQIADLKTRGVTLDEASRMITTYDIRWACDVFRPVYERTGGQDGRVSLEVDPRLAKDTAKTIAEARALWWVVDRPNLFIKIPATAEGLPGHRAARHLRLRLQPDLHPGTDSGQRTYAQMTSEEKNKISHRSRAVEAMRNGLGLR